MRQVRSKTLYLLQGCSIKKLQEHNEENITFVLTAVPRLFSTRLLDIFPILSAIFGISIERDHNT